MTVTEIEKVAAPARRNERAVNGGIVGMTALPMTLLLVYPSAGWSVVFGFVAALIGGWLSVSGYKRAGELGGRRMAVAGMVTSGILVVMFLVPLVTGFVVGFADGLSA